MKFSIVVATYNRAKSLKACVLSVLAQSYENFELLVIDDGSTDTTPRLMSEFNDERVRYIQLDRNYGSATPARNRGIDEMTGDVLIIWDSDDILLPNALKNLKLGFDRFNTGVVCVSTIFYRGSKAEDYPRIPTGLLTKLDWIRGGRPRDAEIIGIRKEHIGDIRFRSRNIDFMFYVEVMVNLNTDIGYINETSGHVFLESDKLSLTKQRKKMNISLSQERGEILDMFLSKCKDLYFEAGAFEKFAGYAYGPMIPKK
jgi:glycosyltransferase involved in cell wall biosynthesis